MYGGKILKNSENFKKNNIIHKNQFNYTLPQELIAQSPIYPRDHSRLLCLNKKTGDIDHKHFYDVIDYLDPGDCLVLNDSKVFPARIFGEKINSEKKVEFLLLNQIKLNTWESLVRPGKKVKLHDTFIFGKNKKYELKAKIIDIKPDGNRIIQFDPVDNFFDNLEKIGLIPLPPYIKEKLEDKNRYQTIYAKDIGSSAAPTAGLHFTSKLLEKIKEKGIKICFVTLHIGLGTFRPVKSENILDHKMHSEYYSISSETAKIINETKKNNKKLVAVGTTSCRTLESVMSKYGEIKEVCEWTDIFMYPGYKFKAVDALITNFHLPESTLIMLVSAFAGLDNTMNAYNTAVNEKYRFFSFGDAMIIL